MSADMHCSPDTPPSVASVGSNPQRHEHQVIATIASAEMPPPLGQRQLCSQIHHVVHIQTRASSFGPVTWDLSMTTSGAFWLNNRICPQSVTSDPDALTNNSLHSKSLLQVAQMLMLVQSFYFQPSSHRFATSYISVRHRCQRYWIISVLDFVCQWFQCGWLVWELCIHI